MIGASPTPLPDDVAAMIPAYLGRQRWYAGGTEPQAGDVDVLASDLLADLDQGTHRLWWTLVRAEGARYQLVIGERPSGEPGEFLNAHRDGIFGATEDAYFYDATLDPEMALVLLDIITEDKDSATRVRPVTTEQSNTSLVYDDRVIMKLFRRLIEGRNPDVEVTMALDRAGFDHVATPVAAWSRGDDDLAFVQQYLSGGAEGGLSPSPRCVTSTQPGPMTRPRRVATSAPSPPPGADDGQHAPVVGGRLRRDRDWFVPWAGPGCRTISKLGFAASSGPPFPVPPLICSRASAA